MAIIISVPMILGASFGELGPATTVCLGALNGGMADVGGSRSSRWHALGAAMVLDAMAIAVGTLAGQSIWVAVPLMFVVALACGLANLFGNVAANVGFVVVVLYMVGAGAPGGGSVAFERLWLTLIGAAWALVVVLFVWPVRPFEAVTKGLAETCSRLGALVRTIADSPVVVGEGQSKVSASARQVRDLVESTRETLVLVRRGRRGESDMAQRMLVELGELRRVLDAVEGIGTGGSSGVGGPGASVARETRHDELWALADIIGQLGEAIRHADASLPERSLMVALQARIDAWEAAVWKGVSGDSEAAHDEERSMRAALLEVSSSLRTMTGALGPRPPSMVDDGATAELVPAEAEPTPGVRHRWWSDQRHRVARVGDTLRANATVDSLVARHALRYGTATAIGLTIAMAADVTKGYWITLTIAVVLRPFMAATLSRAVLRVAGTVLGAALTALLVTTVTNAAGLIALLFVLSVLAFSLMPLNYALGVVFLTPLVITLISLTTAGGWVLAEHRILNTMIGGALALAGGYLLWPGGSKRELVEDIQASLLRNREFFDATMDALGREPAGRDYGGLVTLHLQAGLALDNVVAKFQQALGESAARRGPVEVLWSMMESSRAIYLATTSIEQRLHVSESPLTLPAVGVFRRAVDQRLDGLIDELRHGRSDGAVPSALDGRAGELAGIERAAGRISDALSDLRRESGELDSVTLPRSSGD
jgi:uncharacterized membrane protein YccC